MPRTRARSKLLMALASASLMAAAPNAQRPLAQPADSFAGITRLECTFTTSSSVTWTAGEPRFDVKPAGLRFQMNDINPREGSARYVLGAASTSIVANLAGSTLLFMDRRLDGTMAMTSVFAEPRQQGAGGAGAQDVKFRAVHSRTEYYAYDGPGFTSVPQAEQFYGYCEGPR